MSLTATSSSRYLEERMLPGNECALNYAKSPTMLGVMQQDHPAVSPRLQNKEPFRPMTRRIARAETPNESMPLPATSSPFTSPRAQPSPQRSVTIALSSGNTTPTATPRPASPVRPVSTTVKPALLRSTSPVKLSSPKVARPMATETMATMRPSSPTKARVIATPAERASSGPRPASPERPSSPVKIRAKITTGISPKRKPAKNAVPPKPNIVRNTSTAVDVPGPSSYHHQSASVVGSQGLGISLEDVVPAYACEEDSEASGAETSFVFDGASSRSSGMLPPQHQRDAVTVHVRLRPLPSQEPSAWVADPFAASIALNASVGAGRFSGLGNHNFDAVHTGSSNDGLYKTLARPLVHSVLSGFNALIFAYGQTASGKTFTLSGDEKSGTEGITQKAIKDLFRGIRASKREREWLVRCSWLEVYNEGVKDLLEPNNLPQVRSSTTRGTFVSPLSEVIVTSPQAVYALLDQGQANRHVNATDWNEKSSRSHTAFKIVVESWARGAEEAAGKKKKVRISELVLVDLAGSEKYVTQGGKERRAEGANINKSLLTLGKVIYALSERAGDSDDPTSPGAASPMHIPYRDSKLTRILQSSLSGNSKIAVVATLNQSVGALEESLSTINFAKRIKRVRLSAKLNEVDAPDSSSAETQALLVRYRSEADALRRLVVDLQQKQDEQERALDAAANSDVARNRIQEVQARLREIGLYSVFGEGEGEGDIDLDEAEDDPFTHDNHGRQDEDGPTPRKATSPSTPAPAPSHLDFTFPATALRTQLRAAQQRITSLESKASVAPPTETEKDLLIASLQRQLAEAEIALEASSLQPLPKVREEVEAEYTAKLEKKDKELRDAHKFSEELNEKCKALQKNNQLLLGLVQGEMAVLHERLREEAGSPTKRASTMTPVPRHRLKPMASTSVLRPATVGRPPKPRPMSVLGDVGMKGLHFNSFPGKGGATSGSDEDEVADKSSSGSPFSTPRASRTARSGLARGGDGTSTPTQAKANGQSRTLMRGTRAGTRARSSSVGSGGAGGLTRSDTVVMSLKSFGGAGNSSDADESAILDASAPWRSSREGERR